MWFYIWSAFSMLKRTIMPPSRLAQVEAFEYLMYSSTNKSIVTTNAHFMANVRAMDIQAQDILNTYKTPYNKSNFIERKYGSTYTLLSQIPPLKEELFALIKANKESFTPALTDEDIQNWEKIVQAYCLAMYARTKMASITLLKFMDSSDSNWVSEFKTIIKSTDSFELAKEKLPEFNKALEDFKLTHANNVRMMNNVQELMGYLDSILPVVTSNNLKCIMPAPQKKEPLNDNRGIFEYTAAGSIFGGVSALVGSAIYSQQPSFELTLATAVSMGITNGPIAITIIEGMNPQRFFNTKSRLYVPCRVLVEYFLSIGISYELILNFGASTTPLSSLFMETTIGTTITAGSLFCLVTLLDATSKINDTSKNTSNPPESTAYLTK